MEIFYRENFGEVFVKVVVYLYNIKLINESILVVK